MSIAANETDKQVGAILEAIQDKAPEMLEQAVLACRFQYIVWIVILTLVASALTYLCKRCWSGWRAEDYYENSLYGPFTVISGLVAGIVWLGAVAPAICLVQTYIAPDYVAAECLAELGRKALGN